MIKKILVFLIVVIPASLMAQVRIGERTFHFNDSLRKRPLTTEVWYPTSDTRKPDSIPGYPFKHVPTIRNASIQRGEHPLIMISHGTGGGRMTLEWLADALVAKGFIVAAVDHWGNTYNNKIAIDFVTPWQRPQDISFVLTQLLKNKELSPVIDSTRIGAAGFSIGGYTVIALAGGQLSFDLLDHFEHTAQGKKETTLPEFPNLDKVIDTAHLEALFKASPDLKDRRIRAFFAMCPAIGQGFVSGLQVSRITAPFYIVGAQSDSIAPVKTNAARYHQLIKTSSLFIVPGKTGHYVFLNEPAASLSSTENPFMFDDATVDRHKVHDQVGKMAVNFFTSSLR